MRVSRREWLGSVALLALGGCRRQSDRPPIAGSLGGTSHRRGHLLRDGFRPRGTPREETGVAILGAGMAGLSAAWALERAGCADFIVLELEDQPGGTSRSGANSVSRFPLGAHYVPVPDPANRPLVALLGEIGAVTGLDAQGRPGWAEEMLVRDPQERVFFRGEWYEGLYPRAGASREDLDQLARFQDTMRRFAAFRDGDGRPGFAVPRARCSSHPKLTALDRISMAAYLDHEGFTSARLRWLVEYACKDDFGGTLSQISAWAGVHYHASRLAPDTLEQAEYLTWPEGNGRLADHLAHVVGPRQRSGVLVTGLRPDRDGVTIDYHDAGRGAPASLRAGHAIVALPRFVVSYLMPVGTAAGPALRYSPWMVANLTLRDRPRTHGFPLAWDNVIYDSPSLGYVTATHQTGVDRGPTVLTYFQPLTGEDVRSSREQLLQTTWAEWTEHILSDLGPAHPGFADLVERVDVWQWGHAMVRPEPGLMWSQGLRDAAQPVGRVHFAHTDLSGMALMEEAHYHGIRAAEEILCAREHAHQSWLT